MGYTHHDAIAVTGTGGLAFGTATAGETRVIDSSGNITVAGTLTGSAGVSYDTYQGVMTHAWVTASTAVAPSYYYTAPYACSVAGYVNFAVSSGTGRIVAVSHGSAGDNALATASGISGSIGASVAMTASADVTFTAGEVMKCSLASCATVQTEVGLTILLTKV